MKIGTRSLLFGYHQFLLHPLCVALAWWKLFGFPADIRLWIAFFVHDLGYWGKPNMDGPEGEEHPYLGAQIMSWLFDTGQFSNWYDFALYHSRFLARKHGCSHSMLCVADKAVILWTPTWLQILLCSLTGEIHEYMRGQNGRTARGGMTRSQWVRAMKSKIRAWLDENHFRQPMPDPEPPFSYDCGMHIDEPPFRCCACGHDMNHECRFSYRMNPDQAVCVCCAGD